MNCYFARGVEIRDVLCICSTVEGNEPLKAGATLLREMEKNQASPVCSLVPSPNASLGPSPRSDLQPWKTGPETILLQCESLCNQILSSVQADVLNVPHHDVTEGVEHPSKATVLVFSCFPDSHLTSGT